jgi:heat shock protein HslJ
MRNIIRFALLGLVLLALASCQLLQGREATADLAGTSWVLSSLDSNVLLPGTTITLQFGADDVASGSDGCNRFRTSFSQDGAKLTFGQPGASTMMACPEPVMDQATAFMAALATTTRFSTTEDKLVLRAGNKDVATLTAISQGLADTAWDVVAYNNGREAVVGLLLDTEITANFGADGQVSGNAGCNQYFASYSVNGNAIEIGLTGTTFMFCAEPPGVMEQESEYLAALQSAATYRIEGDQLEMRTAADQIAVMMTRRIAVDLPEPTPLPTTPWARVTAPQGTSIHTGPGVDYPLIGFARTGDEGVIVGRDADWRWWAVTVPSAPDGVGWVSADDVIAMNVGDVPVLTAPPPSVPTAAPPAVTPTQVAAATPVPPTATPVPPTARPIPPTATPVPPTATPAAQIAFWADQTNIQQGQCTTLRWSVENVQAVWVYPRGEQYHRFPRTGQGSEAVCPPRTTTYEMRVLLRDGSTTFREVTINVAGPSPTVAPTPAPNPLAGTRWEVINYNNGRGGLVSLLDGTRIAMDFGADGQLTGNAGCNNYFTYYQLSGSNITIGQPGSTSLTCAEPEGVMDQEAEFLAALQTAATFRIDGDTLELRSAAGVAVIARRVP